MTLVIKNKILVTSANCENLNKGNWDLPAHVKSGIAKAQKQAAEGLLTSHDEVMKKYAKYL